MYPEYAPDSFELMAVVALGILLIRKGFQKGKNLINLFSGKNSEKAGKAYRFYSINIV